MKRKTLVSQAILNIIFILLTIFAIAPFLLLISSSLTDESMLSQYGYNFWPRKFSFAAYQYLFTSSSTIIRAYGITIFVTFVGTILAMTMTVLFAYPLSRKDYPFRKILSFVLFFTMLFNGGLIPTYMMWTQMFHIKNTIWALLIPGHLMPAFYVIMMRSYFNANIPDELVEAARMDGANERQVLLKVIVPCAKPIMATIALMIGLSYWNDWQTSLYYITDSELFSIQAVLNTIMTNIQFILANSSMVADTSVLAELPSIAVRMAIAFVGIIPILIIYPFFQNYFVKGIVVGGVKG